MRRLGALIGALLAWPSAAGAEPSLTVLPLTVLPLGFAVEEFRGPESRVAAVAPSLDALRGERGVANRPLVLVWGRTGGAVLMLESGAVRVLRLKGGPADLEAVERGRDAIPDARIAASGALTATLTGQTSAYPHAALGSAIHAESVTVAERRPVRPGADPKPVPIVASRVAAGPGAVFEDREPRLSAGPDGSPVVVTVKSYLDRGSALAILAKRRDAWEVAAETPPLGQPQTWLNPAAIGSFDDGRGLQIALVARPHQDGLLQLWTYDGASLSLARERAGYANHAFGSRAQTLAATLDIGEPRPGLAIPTLARDAVAILSLRGRIAELKRIPLPGRAATGLARLGEGADQHILVGLEDGRVVDLRP